MNSFFSYWRAILCFAFLPVYVSGGKKSQATTNTSQNYDNRQVNTDSGNTAMSWDSSQGSNNSFTTITDGGAVAQMGEAAKAAIQAALTLGNSALGNSTAQAVHAYDYADSLFAGALDAVQDSGNRQLEAFDRAATITQDAMLTAKTASANSANMLQSAYADAKGTTDSQKTIMYGVLAVAGVAILAAMKAKG